MSNPCSLLFQAILAFPLPPQFFLFILYMIIVQLFSSWIQNPWWLSFWGILGHKRGTSVIVQSLTDLSQQCYFLLSLLLVSRVNITLQIWNRNFLSCSASHWLYKSAPPIDSRAQILCHRFRQLHWKYIHIALRKFQIQLFWHHLPLQFQI